jgi:DNA processing protein
MTSPRSEWPALIKLRTVTSRENAPLAHMLERCGSAESALLAVPEIWREVCSFMPKPERLGPTADPRAEEAARALADLGAIVVDVRQPDYPEALRRLPQPPPVLFVLGRLELLSRAGSTASLTARPSMSGATPSLSSVRGSTSPIRRSTRI